MLYDGDGVYCMYCSKEGAVVCFKCEEILKSVPEKIYKKIRVMSPEELIALEKHLGIDES
jgi:hypothetical protein